MIDEITIKLAIANNRAAELYEALVVQLIRQKYKTADDELAIIRQKDTKPEQFKEYDDYCEASKVKAKRLLQLKED